MEYDDGDDMWARGAFRQRSRQRPERRGGKEGGAGSANGFRERMREGGRKGGGGDAKKTLLRKGLRSQRASEGAPKTRAHYSNQRERTHARTNERTNERTKEQTNSPREEVNIHLSVLSTMESFLQARPSASLMHCSQSAVSSSVHYTLLSVRGCNPPKCILYFICSDMTECLLSVNSAQTAVPPCECVYFFSGGQIRRRCRMCILVVVQY